MDLHGYFSSSGGAYGNDPYDFDISAVDTAKSSSRSSMRSSGRGRGSASTSRSNSATRSHSHERTESGIRQSKYTRAGVSRNRRSSDGSPPKDAASPISSPESNPRIPRGKPLGGAISRISVEERVAARLAQLEKERGNKIPTPSTATPSVLESPRSIDYASIASMLTSPTVHPAAQEVAGPSISVSSMRSGLEDSALQADQSNVEYADDSFDAGSSHSADVTKHHTPVETTQVTNITAGAWQPLTNVSNISNITPLDNTFATLANALREAAVKPPEFPARKTPSPPALSNIISATNTAQVEVDAMAEAQRTSPSESGQLLDATTDIPTSTVLRKVDEPSSGRQASPVNVATVPIEVQEAPPPPLHSSRGLQQNNVVTHAEVQVNATRSRQTRANARERGIQTDRTAQHRQEVAQQALMLSLRTAAAAALSNAVRSRSSSAAKQRHHHPSADASVTGTARDADVEKLLPSWKPFLHVEGYTNGGAQHSTDSDNKRKQHRVDASTSPVKQPTTAEVTPASHSPKLADALNKLAEAYSITTANMHVTKELAALDSKVAMLENAVTHLTSRTPSTQQHPSSPALTAAGHHEHNDNKVNIHGSASQNTPIRAADVSITSIGPPVAPVQQHASIANNPAAADVAAAAQQVYTDSTAPAQQQQEEARQLSAVDDIADTFNTTMNVTAVTESTTAPAPTAATATTAAVPRRPSFAEGVDTSRAALLQATNAPETWQVALSRALWQHLVLKKPSDANSHGPFQRFLDADKTALHNIAFYQRAEDVETATRRSHLQAYVPLHLVTTLQQELENQGRMLDAYHKDNQTLRLAMDELQDVSTGAVEIRKHRSKASQLEQRCELLQATVARYETEVAARDRTIAELTKAAADADTKAQSMGRAVEDLQAECIRLQSGSTTESSHATRRKMPFRTSTELLWSWHMPPDSNNSSIASSNTATAHSVDADSTTNMHEIGRLRYQLKETQAKLTEAASKEAAHVEEVKRLRRELSDNTKTAADLDKSRVQLRDTEARLQASQKSIAQKEQEIARLEKECDKLRKQMTEAKNAVTAEKQAAAIKLRALETQLRDAHGSHAAGVTTTTTTASGAPKPAKVTTTATKGRAAASTTATTSSTSRGKPMTTAAATPRMRRSSTVITTSDSAASLHDNITEEAAAAATAAALALQQQQQQSMMLLNDALHKEMEARLKVIEMENTRLQEKMHMLEAKQPSDTVVATHEQLHKLKHTIRELEERCEAREVELRRCEADAQASAALLEANLQRRCEALLRSKDAALQEAMQKLVELAVEVEMLRKG